MPVEQALNHPDRVIAQVMDLGDQRLAQVLLHAEAGWFSPRSWTYWHRKLDLAPRDAIPPLPQRRLGP